MPEHKKRVPEVYLTPVTRDLTQLLSRDTIKVGREQGFSFFDEGNIRRMDRHTHTVNYGEQIILDGSDYDAEYEIMLYNAGHIPGSSSIYLRKESEDISLFYTGDIKLGATVDKQCSTC